ncbi:MAG TPA: hypothetical protein VGR96_03055, partial [Acidobacteriaceae bacterium]|nr:hypothetical protein [Acidobacteriaceae bacterium]
MLHPWLALSAWIPVSLYVFLRYPVRKAMLINFVGGWAILPSACYPAGGPDFAYWILSVSLPSEYFFTKATVLSIAALLAVLLYDRSAYRRFELTFWDLPMVLWCLVPALSGIANPEVLSEGIRGTIYQCLAWGTPYFFGRVYFSDTDSLRLAAKAFVTAGLAYIPVCALEIAAGPQLYAHLYGYQPYRWVGAVRYMGYRPIGLLENGNQLGIWMATSALIAGWLWRRRSVDRVLGLPIGWATLILFATTLLCQSGGSILLLVCFLPFIFVSQRYLPRVITVVMVLGILSFAGLRLANVVSLRSLVHRNAAAHTTAYFLKKIGRGSLGWRLEQDERHVGVALGRPVLGSGEWDWWRSGPARPWGLWLLSFGMYGIVGLLSLEFLQLLPVGRAVWFPLARSDIQA